MRLVYSRDARYLDLIFLLKSFIQRIKTGRTGEMLALKYLFVEQLLATEWVIRRAKRALPAHH